MAAPDGPSTPFALPLLHSSSTCVRVDGGWEVCVFEPAEIAWLLCVLTCVWV